MDLQGLFHCSLHIILLWGLNSTAQVNMDQYPYLPYPMYKTVAHHSRSSPVLCVPLRNSTVRSQPPPANSISIHKSNYTLLKRISTGKVRPGMWKMGTFPKKEANLSASIVAEVTTSFRSERRATT